MKVAKMQFLIVLVSLCFFSSGLTIIHAQERGGSITASDENTEQNAQAASPGENSENVSGDTVYTEDELEQWYEAHFFQADMCLLAIP